jgi:hypothetical protein
MVCSAVSTNGAGRSVASRTCAAFLDPVALHASVAAVRRTAAVRNMRGRLLDRRVLSNLPPDAAAAP